MTSTEITPSEAKTVSTDAFDFVAVTDGAGGSSRDDTLPALRELSHPFKLAHFSARDRLKNQIDEQLQALVSLGLQNFLALRGDPPSDGRDWKPAPGSYLFAYQLVEHIKKSNADLCVGVACYPEHPDKIERVDYLKRKIDAGAEFAITQILYDVDAYDRFLAETAALNIPVLPGVLNKDAKQFAARLKTFGAPGVHLFRHSKAGTKNSVNPQAIVNVKKEM